MYYYALHISETYQFCVKNVPNKQCKEFNKQWE